MKTSVDHKFAALSDQTRRAILTRLMQGEASAGELAEPFEMSQPAISRHLKVLEQAGLIQRRTRAQTHLFTLHPRALDEMDPFLSALRSALNANYNRLDQLLDTLQHRKT